MGIIMKTADNILSLTEIERRIQEVRNAWGPYERLARRIAREARWEVLETLFLADQNSPKAA